MKMDGGGNCKSTVTVSTTPTTSVVPYTVFSVSKFSGFALLYNVAFLSITLLLGKPMLGIPAVHHEGRALSPLGGTFVGSTVTELWMRNQQH